MYLQYCHSNDKIGSVTRMINDYCILIILFKKLSFRKIIYGNKYKKVLLMHRCSEKSFY